MQIAESKITAKAESLKFPSIQILRGVAAVFVVLNHSINQINSPNSVLPSEVFAFGVDIFFVISGFIMVLISGKKYNKSFSFFKERLFRIFPLYFILTTALAITIYLAPGAVRHSTFDIPHYFLSIFFIPHLNPATLTMSPLLRVGWTLNLEMYFYAIFALAMAICYRIRIALTAIVIGSVVIVGAIALSNFLALKFYSQDIVIEFVYGMVLGRIMQKRHHGIFGRLSIVILALLAVAALFVQGWHQALLPRSIGWGLPATILVWCAIEYDRANPRPNGFLVFTGDQSYSLYLTHIFTVSALRGIWLKLHFPIGTTLALLGFAALSTVTAWLVGAACFLWLERPIVKTLREYRS